MTTEISAQELVLAGMENQIEVLHGYEPSELAGMMNTGSSQDRKNFMQRFSQFDKATQEGLKNGTLQLVDTTIYSMRNITAAGKVQIFKSDDDIVKYERNISKQKLEEGKPLLVTEIGFQFSADAVDSVTGFKPVEFTAAIKRSELTLEYDNFKVFEAEPVGTFTANDVNGYNVDKPYGMRKLDNPKVFLPNKRIVFDIDTPASAGAIMGIIKGISVRPYSTFATKSV
jgi:hypothetical protein